MVILQASSLATSRSELDSLRFSGRACLIAFKPSGPGLGSTDQVTGIDRCIYRWTWPPDCNERPSRVIGFGGGRSHSGRLLELVVLSPVFRVRLVLMAI